MTSLPIPYAAAQIATFLDDHRSSWFGVVGKHYGPWRVAKDDTDSDLYAENQDEHKAKDSGRQLERRAVLPDDLQLLRAYPVAGVGAEKLCFGPAGQLKSSFSQVRQLGKPVWRRGERPAPADVETIRVAGQARRDRYVSTVVADNPCLAVVHAHA